MDSSLGLSYLTVRWKFSQRFRGNGRVDACVIDLQDSLNAFMALGKNAWHEARSAIQFLFAESSSLFKDDVSLKDEILIPLSDVRMHLPAQIGDYTDFYASKEHAINVGTMFRGLI